MPNAEEQLLATGLFLEAVVRCPACGLSGTTVARPAALLGRDCHRCGAPTVVSVLPRAA